MGQLRSLVPTVASYAVLFDQLLVERSLRNLVRHWNPLGRTQPDVLDSVAGHAALRDSASPRLMAGEAVLGELGVAALQRSRAHHQVRIDESKGHQDQ